MLKELANTRRLSHPKPPSVGQDGARTFANYCMGCHSAKYQRYERVARDLGIPEGLMLENLVFTGAKIAHLNRLPQGQPERYKRAEAMVHAMDDQFGSCTNHGECSAACPKEISLDVIAMMNTDFRKSKSKNRKSLSRS
mgnify:CR=1 FL=1